MLRIDYCLYIIIYKTQIYNLVNNFNIHIYVHIFNLYITWALVQKSAIIAKNKEINCSLVTKQ